MAILSTDAFVLLSRGRTTAVALDDALEAYRLVPTTTVVRDPAITTSGLPTTASRPTPAPAVRATPRAASQSRAATSAPRTAVAADAFGAPGEGVYSYDTSGGESLSLAGARHDYPNKTYATVRRGAGCEWQLEHPIVEEHVDRRAFCGRPDVLLFLSQVTTETFFGQTHTEEIRCDPPQVVLRRGDRTGAARDNTCRGAGSEFRSRVTYVGRESRAVQGMPVALDHVVIEGRASGRTWGTTRVEQWCLPSSGMIVREVRVVSTATREFGATVDYKERATFQLRSLVPET